MLHNTFPLIPLPIKEAIGKVGSLCRQCQVSINSTSYKGSDSHDLGTEMHIISNLFPLIPLPIKEAIHFWQNDISYLALAEFPLIPLPIKEAMVIRL